MAKFINKKTILLGLVLLSGALLFIGPKKVLAVSHLIPEPWVPNFVRTIPAGQAGDPRLLLSSFGWDNSLDSPDGYLKFFFDNQNGNSIRIYDAGYCGEPPDGTTDNNNSVFTLFNAAPDENTDFNATQPWQLGGRVITSGGALSGEYCNGGNLTLTVQDGSLAKSTVPGHQGKYVAYLKASIIKTWCGQVNNGQCQGAVNAFSVQAVGAGAKASYYSLGADALNPALPNYNTPGVIAVQDRADAPSGVKNTYYNMAFEFAPPCSLTGNQTGYLKWGNLEQGGSLQLSNARFDIVTIDRETGAEIGRTGYTPPPDTDPRSVQSIPFLVNANNKYRWEWQGLQRDNALQLWMPFDGAEFDFKCSKTPRYNIENANCDAVSGWAIDDDDTNKQLTIQLFVDGQYIFGKTTDIQRDDTSPPGKHGFSMDITGFKDAYIHRVEVFALYGDGSKSVKMYDDNIGACSKPTCAVSVNGQPSVSKPFDIILTIKYSPGGLGRSIKPIGTVNFFGNTQTFNYDDTRGDISHAFSGFVLNGPGSVAATASAFQPLVFSPVTCDTGFNVASLPYLKIYGNDIAAGGKFADVDETKCSPGPKTANGQPPASIWTFSKKVTSGGTYYGGASSQFGALALGQIDGFSTAGTRNGATAPTTPNDLSFGNMVKSGFWGNPAAVSENGAGFSGIYRCIPDYFSASSKLPAANAILKAGTPFINDPNNNDANDPASKLNYPIADSKRMVIFVNGDNNQYGGAYIQKNITFANTTWSDTSKIPSFYLIVKGDIFIDDDVTQLDGVYIAQPRSDGSGGHIYTCTNGGNEVTTPLIAKEDLFTRCGKTLTITGSFIANQIKFQRARGTVENATAGPGALNEGPTPGNNIAEIFNFSQEMYLAPTPSILDTVIGNSTSSNVYQSITSLPPVL